MPTQFSIIPTLFLLGAAHGVFLAFILFSQGGGARRANRYLGLYTLVFVAALVDYFIDLTGLKASLTSVRTLLWPKEFLYGTLIYFYTRELTNPGMFPLRGRQWWHFSPALVHLLCTWPLLFLPAEVQYAVLYGEPGDSGWLEHWSLLLGDVELVLAILHIGIYLLLSLGLILIHQRRLKLAFSYQEKISLTWLRNLLVGSLIVYVCWLLEQFLPLAAPWDISLDFALGLSMVFLIYSMSVMGLRQPRIFVAPEEQPAAAPAEESLPAIDTVSMLSSEANQKYRHSALSEDMSRALIRDVEAAMEGQKLYRDGTLSLPGLAAQLGLPLNYLSQAINQQTGRNFFDYINGYRVDEIRQLLRQHPDAAVLELALAAGFNSKSAFYAAFRKHTGQTPGQFRKSLS